MYLIEHFSRLQTGGREDTVSVYLSGVDEEQLAPEVVEAAACFMRMAATLAKLALVQNQPASLESACRLLNRALEDASRDER